MRFLHTSDWHLGRSLHRADLRAAQAAFLDHLVETARAEKVDAVLVSGDVYDRAIPPVDAVELFEDALVRLRATGARVILISGNHDSARRLGFSSALIDAAGVHLRTRASALASPVLLDDDHGQVAVYGIPYLEPALGLPEGPEPAGGSAGDASSGAGPGGSASPDSEASPDSDAQERRPLPRSHRAVLGESLRRIRAASAGQARRVVLAHAWVTGAGPSEVSKSERDIRVGGIGDVPSSLFDGFSYVALGHLHGQQVVAEHVRYSGSPLPYSFSEAHQRKGSWLVELGDGGKMAAERVDAPVYRRLSEVRGRLPDLLSSRELDGVAGDFLAVTLTDPARPDAAMDRLLRRFPHVLTLDFKPEGVVRAEQSYGERVRGKDDLAVAAEFIEHVRNTGPTAGERDLLAAAFTAVRTGEQEA
ncbi:MAG TPA: exonuclease SbcCD subunit D [Trebonia sp.]|jgi:exonuclease SbcD|nr:exonuclease SbcCD subunit D [Trebonia sp.]